MPGNLFKAILAQVTWLKGRDGREGYAMRSCAWCEQLLERPLYCKTCRAASYCGSHCQRLHWFAAHRGSCRGETAPHKLSRRMRRWWRRARQSADARVRRARRCARRLRRRLRRRARALLLGGLNAALGLARVIVVVAVLSLPTTSSA